MLRLTAAGVVLTCIFACGARSELIGGRGERGSGGAGGEEGPQPCLGVDEQPCGSDEGLCSLGVQRCQPDGFFGPCVGSVGPFEEACSGLDEDCDGVIDNGFGVGEACDGADRDLCLDDVMTCEGCTLGPDAVEVCNGVDDNCNGEIDSDCEVGGCSPTLLVTGSVPSDPDCINLPVEAGSTGVINYPCEGGAVSATLGGIPFTGSVTNGMVSLYGSELVTGPGGCSWRDEHYITGSISSGTLQYFYDEVLLTTPPDNCWLPCTETGTVEVQWLR